MSSPTLSSSSSARTRRPLGWRVAFATAAITALAASIIDPAARAQAPTTPLSVSVAIAVPQGVAAGAPLPLGQQYAIVSVANPTAQPISNVQIVFRAALPPAIIGTARDSTQAIGVIDYTSVTSGGIWYHTIAQVPAGASLQYTVTWTMPCPGRFPVAVRVADRVEKTFSTWAGNANPTCPPDETSAPQPASYYTLPWPPSAVAGQSVATTSPSSTTTTIVAPSTSSTAPSSSSIPASTGPTTAATSTVAPSTLATTVVPNTVGSAGPTTPPTPTPPTTPTTAAPTTLFPIVPGATATTTTTTTTVAKRSGPTTTVVIVCRTVGGRRYCGPQSSVYKPGQKKAVETRPKTAKTTKKRK